MRKIGPRETIAFAVLSTAIAVITIASGIWIYNLLPENEFRATVVVCFSILFFYLYAIALYRIVFAFYPLAPGQITMGGRAEVLWNLNVLFYLLFFNTLVRSHVLPVPLMRAVYLALGARLGRNTYSAGTLLDPSLTSMGHDCIVGHDAVIFAHAVEADRVALHPVVIGDRVTVGAMSVIMPGVVIGDDAIVSAGSVVTKAQVIPSGEVWGGVPAKRLR